MRSWFPAVVVVAACTLLSVPTATPAAAFFGDTCYRDIKASGSVQRSMGAARSAAISAWQTAANARYGQRFANWNYSADRTFDCTWDASGTRIRCTAVAGPCGRR